MEMLSLLGAASVTGIQKSQEMGGCQDGVRARGREEGTAPREGARLGLSRTFMRGACVAPPQGGEEGAKRGTHKGDSIVAISQRNSVVSFVVRLDQRLFSLARRCVTLLMVLYGPDGLQGQTPPDYTMMV